MEFNLKGKTVLVTGAGQGIGKALCLKLANCGANVLALSRTKSHLEALVMENTKIQPILADLGNWAETKQALEGIGKVDALVNNAGISIATPLLEVTEEEIDRLFSVNVKAVINVTQTVVPGMIEQKHGSIVNLSSLSSLVGVEGLAVYGGTKSALDGITRTMALELGKHNIRVNCVNPTIVMTAMGRQLWSDPAKHDSIKATTPLGRFAEVQEVVDTILFLLSDSAGMINGVTLPIDGGYSAI